MKLQPQNAQEANKPKTRAKRERRQAPRYTLVWSEEVQTLPDFSAAEVIDLRKKALWRIELAEAARAGAPAVANLGGIARVDDIVWSKFDVGKYWFCLEFRPAAIREYHVTLVSPPSPEDLPPTSGIELICDPDRLTPQGPTPTGRPRKKTGGSSKSRLINPQTIEREITVRLGLTRRQLERSRTKVWLSLCNTLASARYSYCNVSYNMRVLGASLYKAARRGVSSVASCSISFTRMRDFPTWRGGSEARLEPRCVGQNTGLHVLLYSWIRDEPPRIDWSADLFGISPSDWAANLFGVLPEEERVLI